MWAMKFASFGVFLHLHIRPASRGSVDKKVFLLKKEGVKIKQSAKKEEI